MTLSIIIVSYNVRDFLGQALTSIQKAVQNISHEIFVVDNASSDGTVEYLKKRFPDVTVLANRENLGFGRANNQAIVRSAGEYICLINPDTIVQEDTFSTLISFFEKNQKAGAVGCKILNPDGTLQLACRRSFPTPWVAFTKIAGLAKIFPKSRLFGRYNLTYLDPGKTTQVEAISGSFMLIRRAVIDSVGGFDEHFFMYGEDLDLCYRIREAGREIYYVPETQIVHFKGESSKKSPLAQRRLFYEAMRLFVNKHFSGKNALLPSWFLILAIKGRALLSFLTTIGRYLVMPGIDLFFMTLSLAAAILVRFYPAFPWTPFILVHVVYSVIWLASLTGHGIYNRHKFSGTKTMSAVFWGLILNSALTFFFKQYGFSRAVVLVAGVFNMLIIPGWRFLFKVSADKMPRRMQSSIWRQRSIIVGDVKTGRELIQRIQTRLPESYQVVGMVLSAGKLSVEQIEGLPVLGTMNHLSEIIQREKVREVIFSTDKIDYDRMLAVISASNDSGVSFKMVPSNLDVIIGKASIDYIEDIPFVDIEYKLHSLFYRSVKRGFDFVFALLLLVICSPVYMWYRWIKKVPLKQITMPGEGQKMIDLREFDINTGVIRWKYLPWLFSLLRGDISFVGREMDIDLSNRKDDISLSLKPGITGLEQINRNRDISDKERVKYNVFYLKNYSLLLDIEILLKSFFKQNKFTV
ncbi:glycosyltransferase [candidate division KSB1 bacterium]|nr:glycosyltransferase [candidate division KSB1 bacterium]